MVVHDLYDMHTPAWLLNIVISYLSNRTMVLTYNGEQSTVRDLPGGGPQGAFLGGLIFIINLLFKEICTKLSCPVIQPRVTSLYRTWETNQNPKSI